jgi:hypothetical protein
MIGDCASGWGRRRGWQSRLAAILGVPMPPGSWRRLPPIQQKIPVPLAAASLPLVLRHSKYDKYEEGGHDEEQKGLKFVNHSNRSLGFLARGRRIARRLSGSRRSTIAAIMATRHEKLPTGRAGQPASSPSQLRAARAIASANSKTRLGLPGSPDLLAARGPLRVRMRTSKVFGRSENLKCR